MHDRFIGRKLFLVDVNNQFTGIISGADLFSSVMDVRTLKVGDEIAAMYRGQDPESGLLVLSLRKASQMTLMSKLLENKDKNLTMTVVPTEANKGGLLIDLDGMKGFVPVSQLSPIHYPRVENADPEKILGHLRALIGKPLEVRVLNVQDDGKKKIIFSERATADQSREVALKNLKVGDRVEGVVSGILSYGLFVTFDGLEGLVHVSEIDWGHVANPSKFAKIGDKVNVEIIGLDPEKISLSIKRLKQNPWAELAGAYKLNDIIEVPVLKISKFGVFVELNGGINGLIHLSEISHTPVKNIDEVIKVGQKVKAKIITLDVNERRIGLSMKALEPAPAGAEKSIAGGEAAKVDKSKEADIDIDMDGEEKVEKKSKEN
jgi:small subunit ribosomal protein S1